jgi:hypothetical protein
MLRRTHPPSNMRGLRSVHSVRCGSPVTKDMQLAEVAAADRAGGGGGGGGAEKWRPHTHTRARAVTEAPSTRCTGRRRITRGQPGCRPQRAGCACVHLRLSTALMTSPRVTTVVKSAPVSQVSGVRCVCDDVGPGCNGGSAAPSQHKARAERPTSRPALRAGSQLRRWSQLPARARLAAVVDGRGCAEWRTDRSVPRGACAPRRRSP